MAYELSGSIEAGNVTTTIVDTPAFTNTHGGSISPDGNRIAASSQRHGGASSTDHGIDLWHSGSGGWTRVDSIDAASGTSPLSIHWFSNSELLVLTSTALTSYVSSSSGWSTNYTTSIGSSAMSHMWVSPGKTVIGIGHANNVFSTQFMDDSEDIILVHSSSAGFDDLKVINDNIGLGGDRFHEGRVTAVAWVDEENVLIGQPHRDNDTGRVTHFRSGSSGYTLVRSTAGHSGGNETRRFGSFIYWHSASNSGIYGGQNASTPNNLVLNLIPSQSDGYLPASNPHFATGHSTIDTSMLQLNNGNAPTMVLGTTINVDPASPDRVVATTIRRANTSAADGRVYFSLESGSLGWKVKQINADGDGAGGENTNTFNSSQLTPGASRFVTFKTGSAADGSTNNRFIIYETGLPLGDSGGGGGSPASFTLTPSATPLSLTEGSTGTVGVVLGKQPTSDVVISIALAGSLSGRASLSTTTLTFTNANWNTQQSVTVTATQDNIDNDNATGNITFSIVDASSDDEFDPLADQTVALTVQDNDTAGFTLTPSASPLNITEGSTGTVSVVLDSQPASGNVVIDIAAAGTLSGRATLDKTSLTFTTANWNSAQVVTVTAVSDNIDNDNATGNLTFSVNDGSTADAKFDALADQTVAVTVVDNDTAGFTLTPSASPLSITEGSTGTISVVLNSQPTGNVVINVAAHASLSGRATLSAPNLTFTDANWNQAQTITVTAVSDLIDNGNVTANVTFSVNDASTADAKFDALADQTVAVTIVDDDTAGFTLTPSASPLRIQEGANGTIAVVLTSQPVSNVVINVALPPSLTSRASLSATSLTFTNANWNTAQTLTISGTNNNTIDGDVTGNLTFSINDASSSDEFDSVANQTSAVTILDNDTAGLTFAPGTFLSTTEQGASAVLSIKLTAQPAADVVITSTQPDDTEGTMDPNPVSLTFTNANWNAFQTITFTGKEDLELDGNQQYSVTISSTSTDSNFNNLSQVITILNVDSGEVAPGGGGSSGGGGPGGDIPGEEENEEEEERGSSEEVSFPAGAAQRRKGKTQTTQADLLPRKMHFEPSTIETIDKSVLNYMEGLDLFSNSNEGWKKVPIIWASAERAYQVKKDKDLRDAQGMLRLPIISIKRNSLVKDMGSKGVFQGNVPEIDKVGGGSVAVGRVIYQDKTNKFASADALRLHKQSNFPRPNPKTVHRTVIAPMPVNVTVMYDITIRTEYQQQMNDLILPFVTTPGTINFVSLVEGEHRFEGFIQGDFQNNDNLSDFSSDERKFEVKIPLKVIAYLVGQEDNRDKPHYSVRENAVEVKIPRERISLNEIPSHEHGSYYGLSGISEPVFISGFHAPFLFSNVPAVGSGGTGGGTNSGDGPVSSNIVTKTNFSEILQENLVIREILKRSTDAVPSPANQLTIATATKKENTESLYLNGAILAPGTLNDYTISGQVITLNFNLDATDVVFVTYIKQ